tara:strand:- start:209075 stop:210130 length:1056 start_codon:yes stop_codon:yes gene_type:complete
MDDIRVILGPGETIGLFELFDGSTHCDDRPVQPWTIIAGTKNIHALFDWSSVPRCKALMDQYDENFDSTEFTNSKKPLFDALELFNAWKNIRNDWKVDVLYFYRDFLQDIGVFEQPYAAPEPASKFMRVLASYAAHRLAQSSDYYKGFWREALGAKFGSSELDIRRRRQAFETWTRILGSLFGERYSYVMTCDDTELFPTSKFCSFLRNPNNEAEDKSFHVLVPTNRGTGIRFLPLSEILEGEQDIDLIMESLKNMYSDDKFQESEAQIGATREPLFDALKYRKNSKGRMYTQFEFDDQGLIRLAECSFGSFFGSVLSSSAAGENEVGLRFTKSNGNMLQLNLEMARRGRN